MPTVTIRGVELARRGTWAASTGMVTVDDALLSDAVAAAHDPEVDHAPIKFGHIDPRFDGEPAVGWLANMRVEGGTLVADLEDVPAGLAEVLPTAFRRRSVEIAYNVRTPGGKHYKAVITGLALLGVTPPAVKGLADIQALYAEPRRVAAAAALTADSTGALLIADTPTELDAARRAVAALAEAAGANPTARQALDDALTGLGGAAVAGIHHSPGSPGEHVAQHAPPPGGPRVPVTEQRIRELMALEEGADVEAAIQALVAAGGTPTPPAPTPAPPATPPAAVAPGTPAPTPAATPAPPATPVAPAPVAPTAEAPAPAAPAAPAPAGELVGAGTVTLSAAQWADIQTLLGTVTADRRTGAVDKALAEGRIHPSERDAYLAAMTTNEAGTLELLGKLAANKFPVAALGSSDPATTALAAGNEAEWADFGASIGVPGLGVVPTTPAPAS